MINIETGPEGFTLSAGGRRILSHTRRNPCLEIGRAENLVRQGRGSCRLRRRRAITTPLRAFKILEASDSLAVIEFGGKLELAARWTEGRLRLSFSHFDSSVNLFRLRLAASPDEAIFGCGERFERLNLKLTEVRLWVQEKAAGRGGLASPTARTKGRGGPSRGATPFPVPAFISTKNYWCSIDSSAYTVLAFRRAFTLIDSWAVPREIVMGFQPDAPGALADMTSALGRPPSPPPWAFEGAWLGVIGGTAPMMDRLEAVLRSGAKVSAVYAQDWCGSGLQGTGTAPPGARAALDWTWDRQLYPNLPETIALLRARGIRFIGHINPFLDTEGRLYAEASARGYCVKDGNGRDYLVAVAGAPASPAAALLDLTHPEAFAWMKALIKRELLGIGMSGWMADSGGCLPPDAVTSLGEDAALLHNRWPLLWARLNREAVEEAGLLGEALFFLRSGWISSSRFATALWGEEGSAKASRQGGLASLVPAALSAGLSGGSFWHASAGESQPRWMELSAFLPFFRAGEVGCPLASARFWSEGESLALFCRMSAIHAALKPYHLAVAAELTDEGLPPIRHPWTHYETDGRARALVFQYLYGRDLMVAPATSPSAVLTSLYLPADEWVHLWSSRSFRGGQVVIDSPLGYPAVFYRAASPFAPLFDALRRSTRQG
jgi:sulfoquinovosidase